MLLETPAAADIINSFDQIAVSKTNKGVDVSYLVVGAKLGVRGRAGGGERKAGGKLFRSCFYTPILHSPYLSSWRGRERGEDESPSSSCHGFFSPSIFMHEAFMTRNSQSLEEGG